MRPPRRAAQARRAAAMTLTMVLLLQAGGPSCQGARDLWGLPQRLLRQARDAEDEESEQHIFLTLRAAGPRPYVFNSPWYVIPRNLSFYKAVVKNWDMPALWRRQYRMTQETYNVIKHWIKPLLQRRRTNWRPDPLTTGERLSCALMFLAHGGTYSVVGAACGFSNTPVHR